METLFVSKDARLSADGGTLLVRTDGAKRRIPIKGLSQVVLAGEAGLTTSLVGLLGRNRVRITTLDWYGNVVGTFEPSGNPRSGKVRQLQALASADDAKRLDLAIRFVRGAGRNMLANLRYRKYRGKKRLEEAIEAISSAIDALSSDESVEALMGREGLMRAWYYDAWKAIDPRLDLGRRVRRPPNNEINCLISWFNGLMYSLCRNEIAKTHLDDCLSFLHSPREARASLALDLAEVFKPAVCDTLIMEQVLRGSKWSSWFEINGNVCRLTGTGRRKTLELWAEKVDAPIGHVHSLRELILREALSVERHVLGLENYRPWQRKV